MMYFDPRRYAKNGRTSVPKESCVGTNTGTADGSKVKTYQTYTKSNPITGEVYSSRTSGTGSPAENVRNRDANHYMNAQSFGTAVLDKLSPNYQVIRGREQMLIEHYGEAQSVRGTSGNAINGVGSNNKKKYIWMQRKEGVEILNKPRKRRLKLGDIYEIPLPNGMNAYGRLYKECTLAIYDKLCKNVNELPLSNDYRFFVGVYKDLLQDGIWMIVAHRQFESEDDAWAPPQCVVDAITGKGSLYYKGEIIPCSYEENKFSNKLS